MFLASFLAVHGRPGCVCSSRLLALLICTRYHITYAILYVCTYLTAHRWRVTSVFIEILYCMESFSLRIAIGM